MIQWIRSLHALLLPFVLAYASNALAESVHRDSNTETLVIPLARLNEWEIKQAPGWYNIPVKELAISESRLDDLMQDPHKLTPVEHQSWIHRNLNDYKHWIPLATGIGFQWLQDYSGNLYSAPLVHSLITGFGSNWIYWQRDKPSWQRVVDGDGPDNLMEELLPYVTYGYSGYELYDSLTKGSAQYLLHGGTIFLILSTLKSLDKMHLATDALLMETSSIFLHMQAFDKRFLYGFALTFYLYRWGVFPKMLGEYVKAWYWDGVRYPNAEYLHPGIMLSTSVFNALNLYWGSLIARKLVRHLF
ncbi:TLC domain-containing protein [Parendozoicomonas haliclonae]|uniref:TLC domain-containing protein n=1 Tax=Parendozoicomonas haliclonae TaxID=1960125 RepID=UPI0010556D2D|nr:TLC domain-containing protein [Parendozoicomonas haliclonae]